MKNLIHVFIAFAGGVLVALLAIYLVMPAAMIRIQTSPLGLEETVDKLKEAAENQGWVISGVSKIDESVAKHGGGEVPRVRLINFCQASYAGAILRDPDARHVSVFMPCTISVYEGDDGRVHVSSMNAGLLGGMMGGTIAEVMGGSVAADQEKVLSFLSK